LPLIALAGAGLLGAGGPAPAATAAGKYIGAAKCKSCHSSAESGDQYGAWSKAKHSHAFEGLTTDAAKELGAKAGIADPSKEDACLKCHVTGFGEPEASFPKDWKQELGVQCETCHGPAETHMKERFKAAATAEKGKLQVVPAGEVIAAPGVEVCVKCHNPESPSYKPFCYFEARGKISHFDPRKPRTEEERASYGKCPCGDPCPHAEGCPERKCNLKPDELTALKK
jgi:mono/diheme cytochrome c family protein